MNDVNIYDIMYSVFAYIPKLLSVYILYFNALDLKPDRKKKVYLSVCSVLIISIMHILNIYNGDLATIFYILSVPLVLMLISKTDSYISLSCSIISIGITVCFMTASMMAVSIVYWMIGLEVDKTENVPFFVCLALFITMLLMIGMSLVFVKIKRFKKGFAFLMDKNNSGVGLMLAGFVLLAMFLAPDTTEGFKVVYFASLIISIIVMLAGFVLWIRKGITNRYLEGLRQKELARYETELREKDRQIESLSETNSYLSKIVHRDNHLIGSLAHTIGQSIDSDKNAEELKQLMKDMLSQFEQRSDLVLKEQYQHKILPTTGLGLVDGALSNLLIKAAAHGISLDVAASADLRPLTNNILSATELETLICDHIKDAIIAVEAGKIENGRVLLQISRNDGIYEISVKDNADDFDIEVLQRLGLERITTHSDTGGSGIGFMTTFESLKKANASFILDEYRNRSPFTKAVTFRFDNLGGFVINSYRSKALKKKLKRKDILIEEI